MKALVLAGGFPQIALINELKQRGYTVVLADWNEKPVARKFADIYYQVSTLDVDAIREVAKNEQVDFVITACTDQALLTVAKVSEDLGLPCYIDYQTALNVTNKKYMKEMFARYNIPTAKHIILKDLNEDAISGMTFPLIVKPVDCNSSKGVRRCNDYEELSIYFRDAVNYSRTNTAVVEEFIEGEELSVDVYVEKGIAKVLCVSCSKKIPERDKFVICGAIWPANVSDIIYSQISQVAQQIADAFCLKDCPMLIQLLANEEKVFVVEFSARTGGSIKYLLIKNASGFDVIKAVVDLTEGIKPHFEECISEHRYRIHEFVYCSKGVFDHIEGFASLKRNGMIKDYYEFYEKGKEFTGEVNSSGDRICGYSIVGETKKEILQKHSEIIHATAVVDMSGQDIMRHDLIADLCENDLANTDVNGHRKEV